MGRPERPIDPDAGPVAEFAAELRELRDKAGRPSYRELARRASFSPTVLSEAAGGRRLPTLAVVRGFVRACDGDVTEWEDRWRRTADRQRAEPPDGDRPAPYLGLASYTEEQASLFFGRGEFTRDLLRRLAAGRFLAVFGPSGSGKSSLLRAGLLAAVKRGDLKAAPAWTTVWLTPGEQPVATLAARVASLAGTSGTSGTSAESLRDDLLTDPAALPAAVIPALPAGAELLLVVDQFEELFSVCRDTLQRDCFVQALLAAIAADGARTRVVLGVRADFYAQCATWPALVTALRDAQVLVGPMELDQLREVIVKPAEHAGMTVEGALIATALAETGTEPGALPLVSHALLETWRHSPSGRLTLSAYQEAGGVPHAIAATAERVYAGCGQSDRDVLRRIFLRLVAISDGAPDARRAIPPDELAADPGDKADLIETLVRTRLVTIDDGSVQLAHEALIRHWPRLAEWLAEGRDDLRVQRRLSDAAAEWARLGRDPAALYRGTPLAAARVQAGQDVGRAGLTRVEREFLDASDAAEAAVQAATLRTARRLRRLVVGLVVLLAAVTAAGGVAAWQREAALSAESAAISGQLAAKSGALAPANPDAAALAALAAWRAKPTVEARSALLSTVACCASTQASLLGEYTTVSAVGLNPGGKLLAAGGQDRAVHLWNAVTGRQFAVLNGFRGTVRTIAFSPDGDILAAGSDDHTIRLWNPARRTAAGLLTGDTGAIEDLAFSPRGDLLASASADGQIRLWNLATRRPVQVPTVPGHGGPMLSVAFSPDGDTLAAAGGDHAVTLWDIANPAHPHVVRALTGMTGTITNLAYSPNGTMIAGEESGGDALLWNLKQGTRMVLGHAYDGSRGLAFGGGGSILITAGTYSTVLLWSTSTGHLVGRANRRIPGNAYGLAYDPDSGSLALGGDAGTVQLWQAAIPPFTGGIGSVTGLAIIPGRTMIAAANADRMLNLWSEEGGLLTTTALAAKPVAIAANPDGKLVAILGGDGALTLHAIPGLAPQGGPPLHTGMRAAHVAFSPDGRMLAAAGNTSITLFTIGSQAPPVRMNSSHGYIDAIAFSPDGRILAATTSRGSVMIANARTGRLIAETNPVTGPVPAIAFSPDGRVLATAGNNGKVTLWNPANLRRMAVLAGPVGSVEALAFSPGGQILASGEQNGTIMLWSTADLSVTAALTGAEGSVNALAFTPTGSTLISGDASGRIITWDLDPGAVARQDCRTLAGDPGLSQAETLVPDASYPSLCPSR